MGELLPGAAMFSNEAFVSDGGRRTVWIDPKRLLSRSRSERWRLLPDLRFQDGNKSRYHGPSLEESLEQLKTARYLGPMRSTFSSKENFDSEKRFGQAEAGRKDVLYREQA